MLQPVFDGLLSNYTDDDALCANAWAEVNQAYGNEERHFHNLAHLEHLYRELSPLEQAFADWDAVLAALFYHDVAYDVAQYVTANDNEERSAAVAAKTLQAVGWEEDRIGLCKDHILATKKHNITPNADTNFFTDADLSVLGQPWGDYHNYSKAIRKEYAVYPDPIYQSGRIHVLKQFLKMERVFKTEHFYNLYEAPARENMEREIEILSLL